MKYLYMQLSNPHDENDRNEMLFAMDSHSLAGRYCEFIRQSDALNYDPQWVTWGMHADKSKLPVAVSELNKNIRAFNERNNRNLVIPEVPSHPDQVILNEVHSLFEEHIKGYRIEYNENRIDTALMSELSRYLNSINRGVHSIEGINATPENGPARGWFTFTMLSKEHKIFREELTEDDYDHFSLGRKFGDLFLGYATAGKNLFHIMSDNDLDLIKSGGEASPQKTFSTNTIGIFSGDITHEYEFDRFEKWFKENELEKYGYDLHSKYNSIGFLKVGHFIPPDALAGKSKRDIISYYSDHSTITRVCMLEHHYQPGYLSDPGDRISAYTLAQHIHYSDPD